MHRCVSATAPWTILAVCLVLAGCYSGSPPTPGKSGSGGTTATKPPVTPGEGREKTPAVSEKSWPEYPDVPYVEVMTELDGIEIPRVESETEVLSMKGEIPADVGNEFAKANPSEPTTGDWLVVRFKSEPESLNPIVETSAVQTYIGSYVNEALARQDPETLEFEPHIAERWVAEDSVKLSPTYPGKERRVALSDGEPGAEISVDYPQPADPDAEPAVLTFHTSNASGEAVAGTWVGLYPAGDMPGAPKFGYHFWSDADGKLDVSAIVPGTYTVRVGAEVFGETERLEDGSLKVTPATPDNPLTEEVKSSAEGFVLLAKDEWVDVQAETIYTYFLRDDVTWSDGEPFTAKDLEFAYAVVNNNYVDGESLRVYYSDLIELHAINAHTVRMKYRQQYFKSFEFTAGLAAYAPPWHRFAAWFEEDGKTLTLEKLSGEEEAAQKKVSVHGQEFGKFFNNDKRYNTQPIGTGPYMVDKWVRSDRVEVRRNPNYWLPERGGYLDRLVFKFIVDDVTALQALKAGEIDFLWGLNSEQYFQDLAGPPEWFKDKYVKAAWFSPGFSYIGWNLMKPIFKDRRVRIALDLLFDKQEFLDQKLHGEAVLVSGSQYYFGPGYDHDVKPLGYDRETALQLLADAGWYDSDNDGVLDKDGQRFEFTLLMPPGNPVVEEQAALIQKSYKDAGIQVQIRNLEWASFIDKVKKKDFDVVRLGWASPIESDPFQIWHGSQAGPEKRGSNHVSFSNPLADELIEQMRITLDEDKRQKIQYSFHRILDREQPYMFLYTPKDFGAYHKRFQGVKWYRVRPGFDFTEWYVPKDQQVH